jgi:hypothetical protein
MLYLLPFLNAFLLFICLEERQIFSKAYQSFLFNYKPEIIPSAVMGGCILCTAFWIGVAQITFGHILSIIDLSIFGKIIFAGYNAAATAIIYRLLK